MEKDRIKEIVDRHFNEIEIPIALEDRISNNIDNLAKEEQIELLKSKLSKRRLIRYTLSIAATVILIATTTLFWPQPKVVENIEIADTCATVEEAYKETEAAFKYLAEVLEKSVSKVNEKSKPITESKKIINKYLR